MAPGRCGPGAPRRPADALPHDIGGRRVGVAPRGRLADGRPGPRTADAARGCHGQDGEAIDRGCPPLLSIGRRRWIGILRQAWHEIGVDRASIVASGVAFRVALAVFPGVAIVMWVASRTVGPAEARSLVTALSDLLPDASRSILADAVALSLRHDPVDATAEAPWFGSAAPAIGLTIALWSTNSGMKGLFDALNIVYDTEERRGFFRRTAITMAFTLGTLLLLVPAAATLLASPYVLSHLGCGGTAVDIVRWARWPALFLGFAMWLSLLYRSAPNRERRHWPFVTVGSLSAAGLLVLGTGLFSWFTAHVLGLGTTYGSLNTMVAFLLWLWADFFVVLACAELDATIERDTDLYGSKG